MSTTAQPAFWPRVIYVVSAILVAAVAFLILGPRPEGTAGMLDVSALPHLNASLNGAALIAMVCGLVAIKSGRITIHRKLMLTAFGFSAAFLASYIIYHWFKAGPKAYVGDYRSLYLVILLTHIVLSAAILPMVLMTLFRGYRDERESHRKWARVTLPIWLYVSVTGVVIYFMLY